MAAGMGQLSGSAPVGGAGQERRPVRSAPLPAEEAAELCGLLETGNAGVTTDIYICRETVKPVIVLIHMRKTTQQLWGESGTSHS